MLQIRVVPNAARSEICGLQGDSLKVRVTARPVKGAANKACIKVLARALDIPVSRIGIIDGHRSRLKKVKVSGVEVRTVHRRLALPAGAKET